MPDFLANDVGEATITGSAADDWVTPPDGGFLDRLYFSWGSTDNDLISTAGGADIVWLTPGTDTIDGGAGYDALRAAQFRTIEATGRTAAEYRQFSGPTFAFRDTGATIDSADGTYEIRLALDVPQPGPPETLAFTGTFTGFENFYGTLADDLMLGSSGGEYFSDIDAYAETWRPGGRRRHDQRPGPDRHPCL